jgi:hypothetical protein
VLGIALILLDLVDQFGAMMTVCLIAKNIQTFNQLMLLAHAQLQPQLAKIIFG